MVDANKAEVSRCEEWLAKRPIRSETESYWVEFLEDYAGKIRQKFNQYGFS